MYVKLSQLTDGKYRWVADVRAEGGKMLVTGNPPARMQTYLDRLRKGVPDDTKFLQALVTDHIRSTLVQAIPVQD